ncbi:MAG: hypothetical protein PHF99_12530 [Bacteroidales bacterium]|nr:hypothetical protein [Bacteroidales bacterium]
MKEYYREDGTFDYEKTMEENMSNFSFIKPKKVRRKEPKLINHIWKKPDEIRFVWCLVSDLVEDYYYVLKNGEIDKSKYIPSGTKLYCFQPRDQNKPEKVLVIGKPFNSKIFQIVAIESKKIKNWRKEKVYKYYIKRRMLEDCDWDNTVLSETKVDLFVEKLKN